MNSQPGGLFTAVLMLVPLIGVPVTAIVGLPSLPGANAATSNELGLTDEPSASESPNTPSSQDSLDYLFTPATTDPPITHRVTAVSATDDPQVDDPFGADSRELYTPFSEVTDESEQETPSSATPSSATPSSATPSNANRSSAIPPPVENPQVNSSTSTSNDRRIKSPPWADDAVVASPKTTRFNQPSTTLTWEQAVAKLNELGIRNYRLEEDSLRGGYHFYCVLTSAQQQNVRHRFDATAAQPLDAIADVFAQIDRWRIGQ